MEVHVGRLLDIAEALQHVDIGAREDVYHACRALLVHRREDLAVFDRAFDAFWREQGDFSIPAAGRKVTRGRTALAPEARRISRVPGWRSRSKPPTPHRASCRHGVTRRRWHTRTSRSTPRPRSRWLAPRCNGWSGGRAIAARAAGSAATGPGWTFEEHWRTACARAVTSSNCRAGTGACANVRWCCCATSAGRWSATRACSCISPTQSGADSAASKSSSSPPTSRV